VGYEFQPMVDDSPMGRVFNKDRLASMVDVVRHGAIFILFQMSIRSFIAYPCRQNRGKIGDYIAISRPINRELYRDKSQFRHKSVVNRDLLGDFFSEIAIKSSELMIFLRTRI
jgi:hypothetical protein